MVMEKILKIIFVVLFLLNLIIFANGVSESNFDSEIKLANRYFQENFKVSKFDGCGNLKIGYASLEKKGCRNAIVILPGLNEVVYKYRELLYDFRDPEYNFYVLDHRDQGTSDRNIPGARKCYINDFENYVRDLKKFMDMIVLPNNDEVVIIAHSLGGVIALGYLPENQEGIKGVVLCAPMLGIETSPYPEWIALTVANLNVKTGKGKNYVPDNGPDMDPNFETNVITGSRVRYENWTNNILFGDYPEVRNGGATYQWLYASIKGTRKIRNRTKDIEVPIILFQAENDVYVRNRFQDKFVKERPNRKKFFVPGARHEILQETNARRDPVIKKIKMFIKDPEKIIFKGEEKMLPECRNINDIFKYDKQRVDCIGYYRVSKEKLKPGERHKIFLGSYLELEDGTKVILGYLFPDETREKYEDKLVKITGTIHQSIPPEDEHIQQVISPHLKDYEGIEILE